MHTFPAIHSFPPFYTKQSNATILQNQLDQWCTLILELCRAYSIYSILPLGSVLKQQKEEAVPSFFDNAAIDRSVPSEFRKDILNHLVHRLGRGSYINGKTQDAGVLVYWRSLSEWAEHLYSRIEATGQQGAVLTVYEMTKLEESVLDAEFHNIDALLFEKILEELKKQGRAHIIRDESEIGGVKFT